MAATTGLTTVARLLDYLRARGCDRDKSGNFVCRGSICIGLGGDEVCLGDSAAYRADDLWRPIRMDMIVSALVF